MNLNIARLISIALFLFVLGSIILRFAGIRPIWERWSNKTHWIGLLLSASLLAGVTALWIAGWVINGEEGSLGVAWSALSFLAVFAAIHLSRVEPGRRLRWATLLIVGVIGCGASIEVAKDSMAPPDDGFAWYGYVDSPWRATLARTSTKGEGKLRVVLFRRSPSVPALQRRIYDHQFLVRIRGTPAVEVAADRGVATITFDETVLAMVPLQGP